VSVISSKLNSGLRNALEKAVLRARGASEKGARDALQVLGVDQKNLPAGVSDENRSLRVALRAKARQLGGSPDTSEGFGALVADCAYEQWHRMLFARFLAENDLLIHPDGVAVTLEECEELAPSFGEPDAWMLAARFASAMLPGIFRVDDPCLRVKLAPEGRQAVEAIVSELPREIFLADDALGWVYQYWQSEKKDEVNDSERKIAGADIAPVTQLFTEPYMVRFLLENTLGAWWASRHSDSPLLSAFDYLVRDDGSLAVGHFDSWPDTLAELTVMDPSCGSGHFLVDAFHLLRLMRMEEERLDARAAGDAVLRENLFGLELDQRCVQITAFALAFAAWRTGGYRELPVPNVACVGIPARGNLERWKASIESGQSKEMTAAVEKLHELFGDADSLGSLLNPAKDSELGDDDDLDALIVALGGALGRSDDPVGAVFGSAVAGAARAADLLARRYILVATNVPYLAVRKQGEVIRSYCERRFPEGRMDLATSFLMRLFEFCTDGGIVAVVTPQNWLTLSTYEPLRTRLLDRTRIHLVARLGAGAFETITGHVVKPALLVCENERPDDDSDVFFCEADAAKSVEEKDALIRSEFSSARQTSVKANPDSRIVVPADTSGTLMSAYAWAYQGITTGDTARFARRFWEVPKLGKSWELLQSTVSETVPYGGRESILLWEQGKGTLEAYAKVNRERLHDAHKRGSPAWKHAGVAISQFGDLPVTLYSGELFDSNVAVLVPKDPAHLGALWHFCGSSDFRMQVRRIDQKMNVTNATFTKVPFDLEKWMTVAAEVGSLPEPTSADVTQWPFTGDPAGSNAPLQVAVARLLGYRWPAQSPDHLDAYVDSDGIVCLAALSGERPASERMRSILAAAYGKDWSVALLDELLAAEGVAGASLEDWLRDRFFAAHCARFDNRPFLWHISDGRKDGFSALVNYHRLDRRLLERLTYANINEWLEIQRRDIGTVTGAEARVAAAQKLQDNLKLILDGEPPYDIYVRWKSIEEQPLGWYPDIDDGVRLNIRPFVEAGVLRSRVNVKWGKDRGKEADGSERINDRHLTLAEKRAARAARAAEEAA
jgi:N-6 DNA Methylase